MAPPGLSLRIDEKRYESGAPIFAGFRLEVAPGQVVAVLGPSGIGKSTLLRMIAGIDRRFEGQIEVGGQRADEAPPAGYVFQDARLLPWLTALDNVLIGGLIAKADGLKLLDRVGLDGSGPFYPAQLSGGMQRRVALARALAARSGLLLLDEPFVSLDPGLHAEMVELVGSVLEEERPTAVLVSHAVDEAVRLADRVVVLSGRPVGVALDTLLDTPRAKRTEVVLARHRAEFSAAIQTLS